MQEREKVIRESIQEIGLDSFPDNDTTWNILSIEHDGKYSGVESEPTDFVGYEKFKFILSFDDPAVPFVEGCYRFEGGQWLMLFTAPGTPDEWKALFRN